ncbi:hypothetical protein HMPREF9080_00212 [Cardiobacterium valvarum F0432]|uniref:Uncharacterized protein n=1 Tax=Cardiobacterium valvarum F0432 TaxID=797473 RepID=G9ZBT5_9GAMM|nr:hypothetical protein HMPREF9080_00212 [Cardiobacterium valvarum F0432]
MQRIRDCHVGRPPRGRKKSPPPLRLGFFASCSPFVRYDKKNKFMVIIRVVVVSKMTLRCCKK